MHEKTRLKAAPHALLERDFCSIGANIASAILAHELSNWHKLHGAPQTCH